MHIGHNYMFHYAIQQNKNSVHQLSDTAEEKDLVIIVTDNLRSTVQCAEASDAEAAKKAMKVLGMIRRQFIDIDKEYFLILYKSFVRPHMEFAIQAWSPYLKRDIECLEKVQNRATKLVKRLKNLRYMKTDFVN